MSLLTYSACEECFYRLNIFLNTGWTWRQGFSQWVSGRCAAGGHRGAWWERAASLHVWVPNASAATCSCLSVLVVSKASNASISKSPLRLSATCLPLPLVFPVSLNDSSNLLSGLDLGIFFCTLRVWPFFSAVCLEPSIAPGSCCLHPPDHLSGQWEPNESPFLHFAFSLVLLQNNSQRDTSMIFLNQILSLLNPDFLLDFLLTEIKTTLFPVQPLPPFPARVFTTAKPQGLSRTSLPVAWAHAHRSMRSALLTL